MLSASDSSVMRWIRLIAVVSVGALAILIAANIQNVVTRVDGVSHQRDVTALTTGLRLLGEVTCAEQQGLTVWDEAYENVVLEPNIDWMRENLGPDVFDGEEERVLVVGIGNAVMFSSRATAGSVSDKVLPGAIAAVVQQVRSLYSSALYRTGAGWGIEIERDDAMVPGIYAHDIAAVDGMPAVVSASAFIPDLDATLPNDVSSAVLVHVRYLKGTTLTDLAEASGLRNIALKFMMSAEGAGRHALADRNGNRVVMASWDREAPGATVGWAVAPLLGLTLFAALLFAAGGSTALRRMIKGLVQREASAVMASRHDVATGLANRAWFHWQLEETLSDNHESAGGVGVVLVDLDYFKSVNDTLGHAAGDAVILAAAQRMQGFSSTTLVAARLGGDEFALVTRILDNAEALSNYCAALQEQLFVPVDHDGHVIPLSASIGAVFQPGHGTDADALLLAADLALYRAKDNGRGCFRIYEAKLDGSPGQSKTEEVVA